MACFTCIKHCGHWQQSVTSSSHSLTHSLTDSVSCSVGDCSGTQSPIVYHYCNIQYPSTWWLARHCTYLIVGFPNLHSNSCTMFTPTHCGMHPRRSDAQQHVVHCDPKLHCCMHTRLHSPLIHSQHCTVHRIPNLRSTAV